MSHAPTHALAQIDRIRDSLSYEDSERPVLVAIVRDLWDGYPIKGVKALAATLVLTDWNAAQEIKNIVNGIVED